MGKLFSKEQRAFYKAYAPEGIAIDDLDKLGPITLLKLKFKAKGLIGKMVAELWSIRRVESAGAVDEVPAGGHDRDGRERSAVPPHLGISLSGEQQTKTRTALDFYSNELAPPSRRRRSCRRSRRGARGARGQSRSR